MPAPPSRITDFYTPWDKQRKFHESAAKYRLFGGAAGPGKSKALLWEAIYQAHDVVGADTLLLRRTYPELEGSLLAYFRRDVPRSMYRKFNETKHLVTWNNGSTTRFGYCRNENDVYRYQGDEYLFIGIDELTHFTLKQWQFLTSRNRCPVPGSFPCMAGASNPGNIGHAFVKALWIDKNAPAGFDRPELYRSHEYDFIRAKIEDNPIYANDIAYRQTLEALPEHLRRAFLEGDWDVFAGQYFDIFDLGRHVFPANELAIAPHWPRWISIDWGFQHPSAIYWHTRREDGTTITYREMVQASLSPRMLAQAILERSSYRGADGKSVLEPVERIYLSPDAFAHRTAESSIAEQLRDVLTASGLPAPVPADDDRVGGWQLLYSKLQGPPVGKDATGRTLFGTPEVLITANCRRLIECLPTLVRDVDGGKPEDIRKVDGDDPADGWRYGIYSELRERKLPWEEQLKVEMKQIAEPTARAIYAQKRIGERAAMARNDGRAGAAGSRLRWQRY